MNLIIVESPTKAKTIKKFLKGDYETISSYGHIRNLPKSSIGVDIENDFEPKYVTIPGSGKNLAKIKNLAKKSDTIFLATDPDREGEAISWHLLEALNIPKEKTKRIAFHEITEEAVKESLANPREIDMNLVNAQQARRILDRIVGYKLSPFLWKKVARGLSAGRVQSVALRLITDREKEIKAFKQEEYWSIESLMKAGSKDPEFEGSLVLANGKKLKKLSISNKKTADDLVDQIKKQKFSVSQVSKKRVKKNPLPPFITSSLQQEANKRLGFSSKFTMRVAQQLYEMGFTTYHRTDSYNVADFSLGKAKEFVIKNYGKNYWKGTIYKKKVAGAQEAHEAIRPSYPDKTPDELKNRLDGKQFKLYDLIWRRFLASLLTPAEFDQSSVDIASDDFVFKASGRTMRFDGFLKVYPIKFEEKNLPLIEKGETIDLLEVIPNQHFTQPPARYNEASFIKILEEKGIGRPSTYAIILSTIEERNYIKKGDDKRFEPTEIGMIVSDLLTDHFNDIVDIEFTANMEKSLDDVAEGKTDWRSLLKSFHDPFNKLLQKKEMEIDKKKITEKETDEICEKCGAKMVLKVGRFGTFLACSNYPDCKNTRSMEESSEPCEKCGGKMTLKRSRFGSFWGCSNYPDCKNTRRDEEKIGVKCPECKEGDVVKKRSSKGRLFYGCSRYPNCKFITNKKPKN